MANTKSSGSSVLLGKDLQVETGYCAFCGQPSSQLDWFRVSCIEESSRSTAGQGGSQKTLKSSTLALLSSIIFLQQFFVLQLLRCAISRHCFFCGLDFSLFMSFFFDPYWVGPRSQFRCPIVASTAESERLRIKKPSTNLEMAGYFKISISK